MKPEKLLYMLVIFSPLEVAYLSAFLLFLSLSEAGHGGAAGHPISYFLALAFPGPGHFIVLGQ